MAIERDSKEQRILITRRGEPLAKLDGINNFIAMISQGLSELGFKIDVIGKGPINSNHFETFYGLKNSPTIYAMSFTSKNRIIDDILFHLQIYRVIKSKKYLAVIQNGITFFKGRNIDIILVHDWELTGYPRHIQKFVQRVIYARKHSVLVATSTEIANALKKFVSREAYIIPTCSRKSPMHQLSSESRFRLTHVGTSTWKNPLISIDVWRELDKLNLTLTFIGERNAILDEVILKLPERLRNRVEFFVEVDNYNYFRILTESKFCSIPSNYQVGVLSPTCLDSFSCGTPIIATGVSTDLLQPGVNGFDLDSIMNLGNLSELEWQKISENALLTANRFNYLNSANKFKKVIEEAHS